MHLRKLAAAAIILFTVHPIFADTPAPQIHGILGANENLSTVEKIGRIPVSANVAPLTDCDRQASYLYDTERMTTPVPFDRIDAGKALQACRRAVDMYPGTARLEALLGRVFLKVGDPGQAESWFRKAAARGHMTAQHSLARVLLDRGAFVQSAQWLMVAANQGFFASQGLLGDYFAAGQGVSRDRVEAVKWWRFAAEQGDPASQLSLGIAYSTGTGVSQNHVKAVKWYLIASRTKHEPAQRRVKWAVSTLPRHVVAEAQRAALAWRAKSWSDVRMLSN